MTSYELKNATRARTVMRDEEGPWYTLDNAAIIMPAVANERGTSVYRIGMDLDHPIKVDELSRALASITPRFPYYHVELRRGFFWYYFKPSSRPLVPVSDEGYPCMGLDMHKRGTQLMRVRIRGRSLACELSHILADGYGSVIFVKALLLEYFRLLGTPAGRADMGFDLEALPDAEEYEDAYHRFFKPGVPIPDPLPRVFHLPSRLLPPGQYRVITAEFPMDGLVALAKSHGASVTEFMAAVYLESLISLRETLPAAKLRKANPLVSLEIPVNLRRFHPTRTMRNFSLFVLPTIDTRLGPWTLESLTSYVRHFMAIYNDPRHMARQISRNAGGGRNLAVRLVPLRIKDFFARLLFDSLGEGLISGLFSNLGNMQLPPEIAPHVTAMNMLGAPSPSLKTHAAMVSWKGTVYLSFGSLAESRELERIFLSRLASLGLALRVRCGMDR